VSSPPAIGSQPIIAIAAALLCRADGRTLLVRKRGTTAFMQPGGKIELGEQPVDALRRELDEELGLVIQPGEATCLGRFTAPAANEPGCLVEAHIFRVDISGDVYPAAEIEDALWVLPASADDLDLAPITRAYVLPLLRLAG
jgi:8-oxo-dGTP pyrophosphatase MutT (NUDIX family)